MIKYLLNFEKKQFFRSSYWQKSLMLNLLLALFGIYMFLSFLVLGIALFPLLKEQFPNIHPLFKINEFIFFWILADLFMRFFFQKLPVMSVKPFLYLPLKKGKIVHYVLGKSVLSFWNFLPLFAFIPFGFFAIKEGSNVSTVLTWILLMLIITLIDNFLNFIIESKTSDSDFAFVPIILIVSVLYALNYFKIIALNELVAKGINSIVYQPFLLIIPMGILILLYWANYITLKQKLYIDASLKVKSEDVSSSDLSWLNRFGVLAPFLQLDLRMLWRNKRTRSSVTMLAFLLLYGLIFYPNPRYAESPGWLVFVGIFITGGFLINFGQFIPAWDSAYYKLLMSQRIQYYDYLRSKHTLMSLSVVLAFLLSIPYVYFGWKILLMHFAAMIFNIGVNTYVLLYAGSYNRKRIDLTQRAAFNYQGTGAVQWIIGIPLLLFPMLLFFGFYKLINFEAGVAALIIVGLIGIILHHKLMQLISNQYQKTKYVMIAAFEQTE